MGIRVVWDNDEKTIIRYIFESEWAWEDIRTAANISNAMLDEIGRVTHFIYDTSQSKRVPDGALTHLRRYIGKEHPLTGHSVLVGAPKTSGVLLARGILSMMQRVYRAGWRFSFTESLEEARALLAQHPVPEKIESP
jgi:hypothetical protein